MYTIYTRTWWKINSSWPNGLEPHLGRKHKLAYVDTEQEARDYCEEWNSNNPAGVLNKKAEYSRYE